jgi:F0F1-type ATP synthase delta subunit
MTTNAYAQALERALLKNSNDSEMVDRIIKNCVSILKKDGREKLVNAVLSETVRRMRRRGGDGSILYIARVEDEAYAQASLRKDAHGMGTERVNRLEIDETLVGGYQFLAGGRLLDKSFKRELLGLYGALAD